jgi:hypothetical protein
MPAFTFDDHAAAARARGYGQALGREVPHAERHGAEGAAYWVGRRG